jgi:hypothetical protein
MQQVLFLKQIPELFSERLASQTVCVAGEPIPPQSSRYYSHRLKIFFATMAAYRKKRKKNRNKRKRKKEK